MSPFHVRARLALPLAAALVLFSLALGFATLPGARASSTPGSVLFTPTSGPVGTSVQVFVHQPLTETTPGNYALSYTLSDPAAGGCASQQPFPGVAPFGSSEANGSARFNWPASLNKGPYWLCASPTSGNGKTVYSSQPYTVTTGEASTATVAPYATKGTVIANVPDGGIAVGSTFTLTVKHWTSPADTPPQTVILTQQDPNLPWSGDVPEINAPFTLAPGPSTGDYVLTVTVPEQTSTAPVNSWAFVMDKAGGAYSQPFKIIAAATPVAASSPIPPSTDSASFPIIFMPIVAVMVCIVVVILTAVFLRRRRARPYR